jgi:hypothetical protein
MHFLSPYFVPSLPGVTSSANFEVQEERESAGSAPGIDGAEQGISVGSKKANEGSYASTRFPAGNSSHRSWS